ncbi:hypothetical protein BCF44_14017 [Kutzneria buriramensis]|uniref:Pyridoxamine 5'-phosphate oxidase N-terminal domain-containing protein n=1 Tax=Kutzneria buriramensis TaxID=1045776 RepID=A0A3E0G7Y9_9PSEU|nr:hypothetical protein BCF44_14017 [Kutzneria buriramensis]
MNLNAQIVASKQISLTTYRKDGTPVPTPVWYVMDGDTMTVVTGATSAKVKRIRNNPRVDIAACDVRGNVKPRAEHVAGTAHLLDETQTSNARALLAKRYIASRVGNWFARALHLKRDPMIGIAITF